jgi:hypothetical protein
MEMAEQLQWLPMSSAPRDGTRILVTIRSVEQGPAEVDVAYWAWADHAGADGWRASDSQPGAVIAYAEPELMCWMPMPTANIEPGRPADLPEPWPGEAIEEHDGSGI